MSLFPKLLDEFHAAILTGDSAAAAASVKKNPRIAPQEQLAIYIDGYRMRLMGAIRSDYPALLALLGDESFDQLALEYIEQHPPEGYNLDRYPHAFAAFVSDHSKDGFAIDLARLEGAIGEVFMMPESEPLPPELLARLASEEFGNLILRLRNASLLLAFDYQIEDWFAVQRARNIPPRPEQEKTFIYIYRHQNNVQRITLSEAAYEVLKRLGQGMSVGVAVDIPEHAETIAANLQAWFSQWMEKGFFRQ